MVGAWLAAATSLRAMLWMTALCARAQIIPLGTLKRGRIRPPIATRPQWSVLPPSRWHTIRSLLAFTGLYVLVYAGESIKYGFLPLYMDVQLHLVSHAKRAALAAGTAQLRRPALTE
jgi:MFS transporter, SET family, sugar efflux transporter